MSAATGGDTLIRPDIDEETFVEDELDLPHTIVVWDDPVNLMTYVVKVFIDVLSMEKAEATARMQEVHNEGKSLVWSGPAREGEPLVAALHRAGLHATLESDQ